MVGLILGAVLLAFVARALVINIRQVRWSELRIGAGWLALAAVCVFVARWLNASTVHLALRSLGCRIAGRRVIAIMWSAWLARYIPGRVAATAGAAALLAREGVRLPTALAAMSLSAGLASLLSAMFCLPLLMGRDLRQAVPGAWGVCLGMLAAGAVCLHPAVFVGGWNLVLRRLKREPITAKVASGSFVGLVAVGVIRCVVAGWWLWLIARAIQPVGVGQFGWILACSSLASIGAVLAVGVPAGLGVREAIYLVALQPVLGPNVGVVVILNRLVQTIVDLAVGAVGFFLLRSAAAETERECGNGSVAPAETAPVCVEAHTAPAQRESGELATAVWTQEQ